MGKEKGTMKGGKMKDVIKNALLCFNLSVDGFVVCLMPLSLYFMYVGFMHRVYINCSQ